MHHLISHITYLIINEHYNKISDILHKHIRISPACPLGPTFLSGRASKNVEHHINILETQGNAKAHINLGSDVL